MKLRCRLGQHKLRPYKTLETERYRFTYQECVRCGVRKADRAVIVSIDPDLSGFEDGRS